MKRDWAARTVCMSTGEVDLTAIADAARELVSAVNASNVERCVSVWAEDGVLMPPNHPSVQGHAAIRDYFQKLFSRGDFTFAFTSSQVTLNGDLAVERVTYTVTVPNDGGTAFDDGGKGLHVYRRQPDGGWKLPQDIWSSDRKAAMVS